MAASYNANSISQMAAVEASRSYISEAIDVLNIRTPSALLIIADFGASHGLNSMRAMKMIIEYLRQAKKVTNEQRILVVHNDLATNDWTSLFETLDNSYYSVANGRSFYEQCLPAKSLSIGYSSTALHWLSRKPCNLSNHCYWMFAGGAELLAFKHQAHLDYAAFLRHRSCELIPGGILIVNIMGFDDRDSADFLNIRALLYKCAQSVLSPKELLDYTMPVYHRSYSECVDHDLFARCSLKLIKVDVVRIKSVFYTQLRNGEITLNEFAQSVTGTTRSWSQSVLKQVLEANGERSTVEDIDKAMAQFWTMFEQEIKEHPDKYNSSATRTFLIWKKVDDEEIKDE